MSEVSSGGIFAVLDLVLSITNVGIPPAFLFAGVLALITSYSRAKLSQKYPE